MTHGTNKFTLQQKFLKNCNPTLWNFFKSLIKSIIANSQVKTSYEVILRLDKLFSEVG